MIVILKYNILPKNSLLCTDSNGEEILLQNMDENPKTVSVSQMKKNIILSSYMTINSPSHNDTKQNLFDSSNWFAALLIENDSIITMYFQH